MNKSLVSSVVAAVVVVIIVAAGYLYIQKREDAYRHDLSKLLELKEELAVTKNNLLGYTKFTDYIVATKSALTEQMAFMAAKVNRDYTQVEHIEFSKLGLKSQATIILKYTTEYSFGFDLKPDSFSITGDTKGLVVTLKKPVLLATPAVKNLTHEIASKGVLIDEKQAVITLQQSLDEVTKKRAAEIQKEEAVIALCEKKLIEFMRDFIGKQPNVMFAPPIKITYSD